ncbi:hypothetical protein GHT06_007516 [Daphnia sinensis]|uniref:Cyclin-dependent kinases regulatory subunit n=1 Tax=Daphnia sinensis TaxID=1820382 RepID=A0AAD5PLU6_9CRUS|nr:hypothetical protein GHT06_007516 [Daphnia sinensis]
MPHYPDEIEYSDKYQDDSYEYRHEWRSLGVQQSRGWVHYELHKPEPHILFFRRARGTDPQTGLPPAGFIPPTDTFLYA